ncbi:hypothetical protein ACLOJK_039316 [Asimina triloba]
MKKSSREREKNATLNACRDEVFGTPYGGGDEDNDDNDDDDMDIARRKSLCTIAEDEHRRQMHSRSQSVREAGGNSGSKSGGATEASSGVKAPSSYEIDGKYAKAVYDEIWEYVQGFRKIWATRGCDIMCDD